MNRILVIGSGGSGKSTLSQQLSKIMDLPIIHLDRFYWKPKWIPTPNEQWDHFVEDAANQEQWIMDGNYSRTLDLRMKRADKIQDQKQVIILRTRKQVNELINRIKINGRF